MRYGFLPDLETEDLTFGEVTVTIQPVGYRQMRIARRRRSQQTLRDLAGVPLGQLQETESAVELSAEEREDQERQQLRAAYDEETVLEAGIKAVKVGADLRTKARGDKWVDLLPESIGQPVFEALIDRYGVTPGN